MGLLAIALASLSCPATAQSDEPLSPIQIDIAAWVQSPQVLPQALASIDDAIWQITAVTGRQLVQVPITVAPTSEPLVLNASTIKVVGGRFIAWRLESPPSPPSSPSSLASSHSSTWPSPFGSPDTAALAAAAGCGAIGSDGPQMTRKLTRLPDGTSSSESTGGWAWELDRAIPGAALKEQVEQMYLYKIKPDLLEKKLPPRPKMEAAAANETREAKLARIQKYQQEAQQYQQQEKALGQLKLAAIRLPERFVAPSSARVWAVLEVRAGFTELTLEGPPPLPWKVNVPLWQAIRTVKPNENAMLLSQAVRELTREPAHRLNHRLAAQTLADSRLVAQAQRADMIYQSAMAILNGPDTLAKQILLGGLSREGQWSAVALELATVACQSDDPATLTAILKGLAAAGDGSTSAVHEDAVAVMGRAAQRLVTWPQPSVAVKAIDELVDLSQKYPAWQSSLARQVSFSPWDSLPKPAGLVVHEVVQAARRNSPLALGWLDGQILNPKTPLLARIALTELAQPPQKDSPTARIRLHAVDHHLLFWLDHASPEMAWLAWNALAGFTLDEAPASFPSAPAEFRSDAGQSTLTLVLPKIMALAWKQKTAPPSLLVFLSHLPSSPWTTAAMLQVAAYASPDELATSAAKLALERSASDRLLEAAMGLLSPPDRQKLAARFYAWRKQSVPAATFLLLDRQARSPVAGWFARELAAGRLPAASAWAAPAGGESALLGLVWSADANLAFGAVSALVASSHGTDEQARQWLTAIRQSGNQSPEYAKAQWLRLRQSLLMQKLSGADGYYRLIVRIWSSDSPESLAIGTEARGRGQGGIGGMGGMGAHPSAQKASVPMMQASLGVVRLLADGQSVRLANQAINVSVPAEQLAIRIDRLVDLKNLNNAEVAKLPLDRLAGPLDLLPLDRGLWSGRVLLPDGQTMQLVLEPVGPPSP